MPKRKIILAITGCALGLGILIWAVPIITALIMGHTGVKPVSLQVQSPQPESGPPAPQEQKTMLMVSGEISVVEDGGVTFIILTSKAGKKYILVGPKTEGLRSASGKNATIVGLPKEPLPQKVKGEPIKRTIEVKNVELK